MMKSRPFILSAVAVFGLVGFGVASAQLGTTAFAPAQAPITFSHPQTVEADLATLDRALNNTKSFSGRFTQTDPYGQVDRGVIHLQRPGKMRFEYDAPNPLLVVSDGVTLVQHDKKLETTDRVPLASTPLNYFLKENVNLARDTEIVGLIKTPSEIRVTARDGSGEMDGDITMIFDAANLSFKSWIIADSFGGQTRVDLSNLKYNAGLNPRLFIMRDDSRRDRRR